MNKKNPIALLIAWLGLAAAPGGSLPAADANLSGTANVKTATITGQVSNAATGAYLEGAVVQLLGTNQMTITDREGRYQFTGVPGETMTLNVSYPGLDSQRILVSLGAGQRVVRDVNLTAEVYRMEKFSVAGVREGTAKAETLQREAPNVKNVVSSDTFGNIADGNVGEMLQHVVGFTADYNGPDVRQVSIRGVSSSLNSMTMDGQKLAIAPTSAGLTRAFEFEQANLGAIERIEVTKAATPDMDAESIGGSVNLVTKSAFDSTAGRRFDYTLGVAFNSKFNVNHAARWKQPIPGFGPSISLSYADVLGEKKNLGITIGVMTHSAPPSGNTQTLGLEVKNDPGPVYVARAQRAESGATRSRVAGNVKVDYKWSENTTVSFGASYTFFHENNDSRRHNLQYTLPSSAAGSTLPLATVDANGNRTGGGFVSPNYSNGITRIFAGGNNTSSILMDDAYDKSGRTYVFQPTVRHRFPGLEIDYTAAYSNSGNFVDGQPPLKYNSRPKGSLIVRLNNIGWIVDRNQGDWVHVKQTEGPDMFQLKNYTGLTLDQATDGNSRGYDTMVSGKFNLRKELPLTLPTFIKTGFAWQKQYRNVWKNPYMFNYTGPDAILGTADDNVGIEQFLDTTGAYHNVNEKLFASTGGIPPWPNNYAIARHQLEHPELWKMDVTAHYTGVLQNQKKVDETVGAAYLMGNVKIQKLSVLGGVRMEETRNHGEGPLRFLSPAETARRAAWVGPVTDEEARRRVFAEWGGRTTANGNYRNFFPSVHLKYEPLQNFITRASWSNGIGRPPFGNIIPNNNVDSANQRVTVSNPNLKPQYSNNYDLSTEYYFKSQGMISAGVFQKKIKDFIATDTSRFIGSGANNGFDGLYEGYNLSTQTNSGSADIRGLEIGYEQQLTFLPGWARGFGINTNFTKLQTKGPNASLSGFLNKTANVTLNYRGYGWDLRMLINWRGEYKTSNSTTPALVQWQKPRTFVSWKSRYAFSRRLSVFCDVENLFSQPLDNIYAGYPDRVISFRIFNPKIVTGITGRF